LVSGLVTAKSGSRRDQAVYLREAVRVLRPGGWRVAYTDREPARPPRCNHTLRIVVALRLHHRARIAGVLQKRKPGMPFYGTEAGEQPEAHLG
jgi:hypothetical protein